MKVQYLLTFSQIYAINLLAHINGKILPEEVDDKLLVEYDIATDKILILDSLLSQKGFIVKDKPQWPSDGDKYYFIDNDSEILVDNWGAIDSEEPSYIDICRRDIGNIFKTEEEAEFERERLKVLNQLKSLSDDDSEWNNKNTHYCIAYDLKREMVDIWSFIYTKLTYEYWFKSKESAEAAIKAIGEDKLKKYVFNIK